MPSLVRSIALGLLLAATSAHAAPWTYRGTLTDGSAPANGRYDIRLSLLDASGNKPLAFPLTFSGVEVKEGAFALDVDFGIDLVQIGAVKLRTEIAQGGGGYVALGEPQVFDAKAALAGVCWDTQGNAGTNAATDFIGTTDAQQLVLRAGNSQVARYAFPNNVIAGSIANVVDTFGGTSQTVAGGGSPASTCGAAADQACGNVVTADFATVGGGGSNAAGGSFSTIAGGNNNTAQGTAAAVLGGTDNSATGAHAAVTGGLNNRATGVGSLIGAGADNIAAGEYSVVSGGRSSCIGGDYSWGGGLGARVRSGNQPGDGACSGNSGDVNGDEGTFVWADAQGIPFVSTGANQFLVRAEGGVAINGTPASAGLELNVFGATPFDGFVEFALIPKPSLNGNTGERIEFGVGKGGAGANDADLRIAHRNDSGAFFEHVSIDGDGSVIVRSNPANTAQGVQLAIGAGAWSTLSDRNLKTDIQSILPLDVLERLVAMPIQTWR